MWLSLVHRPNVPPYSLHQHLWGYFPDLADGERRPFLFRELKDQILLLSRLRPATTAIQLNDRLHAGMVYAFDAILNPAYSIEYQDFAGKSHKKTMLVRGNQERREWLTAKTRGAEILFCQVFDLPRRSFRVTDGNRVTIDSVRATGTLRVKNLSEFMTWLQIGPGKGKVWGCGLVVLPEVFRCVLGDGL